MKKKFKFPSLSKSHFIKKSLFTNYHFIILGLILIVHIFLRFYQLETRTAFGWDQVDNAWVAKDIIVDNKLPLLGMVAKQNSGFNIGPLYYYLITPFYLLFNLDPIASGVFAGVTSIFTFFVIFFICKKIFSFKVALIAVFIYSVSLTMISFDRVQWPVNFIPSVSFIIFYALYKILTDSPKHIILLALAIGFSLHVHFTSIFYILIALLCLPFFPRKKNTLKYILISLPLFLVWLLPNFISEIKSKNTGSVSLINYINTYYHGLHFVRVMQLAKDAFIKFESFLILPQLKFLKYIIPIVFLMTYIFPNPNKKKFILCYLIILWFIIPWVVFSVYKGEISDYYFSSTIPMVITSISYIFYKLFQVQNIIIKSLILILLVYYAFFNIQMFLNTSNKGLAYYEKKVKNSIREGKVINFAQGDPESYIYYIYTRKK